MTYNVVLDIDHTLAFHHVKDIFQANFFDCKGAILSTESLKTHYIYPGILEFIQLLYSDERIKVSFYSKGGGSRNKKFVHLLLQKALPKEQYEAIKSKVRILSKDDLKGGKKDLSQVLEGNERLEDAILIDDRPGNAMLGQEYNLLQVPLTDWQNYDKLTEKVKSYDLRGTRPVKCVMDFTENSVKLEDVVEESRGIHIHRLEDDYEIQFINKEDEVQVMQLSFLDEPELFAKLTSYYYSGIGDEKNFSILEDPGLVLDICKLVDSYGGVTTKICRQVNRICYVAGLLSASLFHANKNDRFLSEALDDMQYKDKHGYYETDFKDDQLYLLGLEMLTKINPDFELISPHIYQKYNCMPDCKMESTFLEAVMNNEYKRELEI